MPNWFRVEDNGVRFYKAWNLHSSDRVIHGFTTRIGGVSSEPFDTLNMGMGTADLLDNVIENRRRFGDAIGLNSAEIVVPHQVHGSNVVRVDASHKGSGAAVPGTHIPETDALITDALGVTLALHFADCVAIFLFDPKHPAIGLVHAGWRGTAAKAVTVALEAMNKEFGTSAEDVQAAVAPAIGRCCYEVGPDVASALFKVFPHDDRVLSPFSTDKWRADLKLANQILLRAAGVKDENISVSHHCTSCDSTEFYSYRRDGECGRMSGWISLC